MMPDGELEFWAWARIDTPVWHALKRLRPECGWEVSSRNRDNELFFRPLRAEEL